MLNYTYSHNWESFSTAAEGHLNILCAYDPATRILDFNTINPQVLEDIKRAEEIADFTIVYPHWGIEYVDDHMPSQETFAKQMTEAGADLIIGTHPHVIEPVVWITADNGNKSLCYYSLGNFLSMFKKSECELEGMAYLEFYKDENGDGRAVSGRLQGNRLVMTYDADGDEFATINIINANTLKLEGFTGTFKRVENMEAAPKVDIAIPVTEAPVDPAYEEVKEYLKNK